MPTACKHRAVQIAMAVCVIVLSSMEVDAQYCTGTAYYSQGYTAYRSRSSRYYVKCGWWNRSRCRRYRYHQEAYTAYSQHSYSYCCTGYGPLPSCPISCGTLTNPANGRVSHTLGTTYTKRAYYYCNTGYYRVGSSSRTCQSTGRWSGSAPICRLYCSTLSNPVNGRVSYTGRTYGRIAYYYCDTGYYRVGSSSRTCLSSGRWSGSAPICRRYCSTLSNPANGRVSYTGRTYQQRATYSCNTGYYRVGTNPRTCLSTGAWSGSAPICRPYCSTLSNPANGRVSYTGRTYQQRATYSCNTGYYRVGSSSRTCLYTGAWSGSAPTCPSYCSTLSNPANGQVSYTGRTYGQRATYSCNTGYNRVGSLTRTCLYTGAWSGSASTCRPVNCSTLSNPANGRVSYTGRTYQQRATYSCNTGYNRVGSRTRTCQATGVWSGSAPTCQDVDECSRGTDSCHDNANCHNTQGSYTCSCNPGYTGNGSSCNNINECLNNNGSCLHNCYDLDGSYTCSCNNGYLLIGDGQTCEDIDECSGTDRCHRDATCHNNPGSYTCSCNTGYTGNGFLCTNINECLSDNGGCDHNCQDSEGSYTCSCNNGYHLNNDGHTCQDVDECTRGADNCHENATCHNSPGNYTCSCNTGYTGDGFVCTSAGNVTFSLRNTTYQNNSLVTLEDIGEGDDALFCITDLTACCRCPYTGEMGPDMGNWFFPNETRIYTHGKGTDWDFYGTRGQMVVLMQRIRGGVDGIYHCDIPDAMNVTQTIYIGVYSASTGSPVGISLTFDPTSNTLACISTGGPATTVTWRRDDLEITPNATYQQTKTLVYPKKGTYQTVLTIDPSVGQQGIVGTYNCTVENVRGKSSMTLVVTGETPA